MQKLIPFLDVLKDLHPIVQALIAGIFTWLLTALGAATVFLFKTIGKKSLDYMLGIAAGVMIAASFWSLLAPAIELSRDKPLPLWFPATIGFILGGAFLRIIDKILPHLHIGFTKKEAGIKTAWKRSTLLILALTLHNIPEGLAIGVAFGALGNGSTAVTLSSAVILTIGMGLQNIPEGLAVSIPLRRDGMSRIKSFWYGQLSGIVEPLAAIIGASAIILVQPILPYALAFAAGSMMFVVIEEVIPESQHDCSPAMATEATMLGFVLMMILDTTFG